MQFSSHHCQRNVLVPGVRRYVRPHSGRMGTQHWKSRTYSSSLTARSEPAHGRKSDTPTQHPARACAECRPLLRRFARAICIGCGAVWVTAPGEGCCTTTGCACATTTAGCTVGWLGPTGLIVDGATHGTVQPTGLMTGCTVCITGDRKSVV